MDEAFRHKVLDGYEVTDVRQGGMSTVYICDSQLFDEQVAIKEPREELLADRLARTLFVRECHAWALLGAHPNIVGVKLLHLVSGVRPQLVLEYLPTSLRERMKQSPLKLQEALRIAIQICDGMRYFNQILPGAVHRDLKPENVMIASDGTAKITDFGLVRTLRPLESATAEERGGPSRIAFPDADRKLGPDQHAAGTRGYMSPEQLRGAADLGPRSDIYSLGCILFQMLAGKRPYRGAAKRQADTLYLEEPLRALPGNRFLSEVVGRCLENDPALRYSGFADLRADLSEIAREHCDLEVPEPTGRPVGFDVNILMALLKLGDLDTVERICRDAEAGSDVEREWIAALLGRVASGRRQWSHAIAHLERAVEMAEEREPKQATMHLQALAMALEASGELERAIEVQKRVVSLQPKIAAGWHNLGLWQRNAGRLDEAIRCLENARSLAGDPGHFVTLANMLAVGKGDLGRALAELDRALKVDPNHAGAHAERARALSLWFAKRIEEERAISSDNLRLLDEARAHCDRAQELGISPSEIQKTKEGLEGMTRLLQQFSSPPGSEVEESAAERGLELEKKGQFERALREYDSALETDPRSETALLQSGIVLFNLGEHERAIERWDRLIELDPDHSQAWANRAGALVGLGDLKAGIESCDRALAIDPASVVALSNKATCLQRLRRFDEALPLYDEAIAVDPEHPAIWYGKGTSLAWSGETDRAIACFDRALALAPGHLQALCDKGVALMSVGRFNDSVACFDRAIELEPRFGRAWFGKGAVLANGFHLLEEALGHFKRARELGDPEAKGAIAQIEQLLGS